MQLKMPSFKVVVLSFLPALILLPIVSLTNLCHSFTHSLPYRTFLEIKSDHTLFDGDYVKFQGFDKTLIKQVIGVEGDEVIIKDGHLFLLKNLGPLQEGATQNGKNLSPSQGGVIEKGKVFVRGTSIDSIDSRYEQIGLLDVTSLKKVRPIL